jgi:hypothetical protein
MLTFVILYIVPTFAMWNYYRIVYGKNGCWYCLTPTTMDAVYTLLPVLNIIASIVLWTNHWPYKTSIFNSVKLDKLLLKFYRIKK